MKLLALLRGYLSLGVIIGALPYNIQNGQQEDAGPVMANFNSIVAQVNTGVPPLIPSIGTLTAFTPTVLFGGANVGMTFFHQWGWYINFGGFVFFGFDVSVNALGASVGQMTVAGFPIAVSASMQAASHFGGPVICRNVNWGGGTTLPYWRAMPATTTLEIDTVTSNVSGFVGLTQVAVPAGAFALSAQGYYFK